METYDPVGLLCDLIEEGDAHLSLSALRSQFGDAVDYLVNIGALPQGAPLRSITCPACDDDHVTEVQFGGHKATWSIYCPEAGRVLIPSEELKSAHSDPMWLANWLAVSLEVMRPTRICSVVPGSVWVLGEAIVGATSLTLTLSRGTHLTEVLDRMLVALDGHPPSELGVVLFTGLRPAEELLRIRGYYGIELHELLRASPSGFEINKSRLAARLKQFCRNRLRKVGSNAGRPSVDERVQTMFAIRRKRGIPYTTKSAEARAIVIDWKTRFPNSRPPHRSTIRGKLPDPKI